jgi:hypothetical protein
MNKNRNSSRTLNHLIIGLIMFYSFDLSSQIITTPFEPGAKSLIELQQEQKFIQSQKVRFIEILECNDSLCAAEDARLIFSKEYDTSGKLVSEICFDCETDSMKTEYTYNQIGLPESVIDYQFPDFPSKRMFEYNSTGKLINENYASGESRKYRFSYTPIGLISKRIGQSYAPDSTGNYIWSDCETTFYSYNKSNKLTEIKWMYVPGWGIPIKQKFTYDQKGRLVKKVQSSIGDSEKQWNFQYSSDYFYNQNGLIEKEIKSSLENGKTWLIYKYIFY